MTYCLTCAARATDGSLFGESASVSILYCFCTCGVSCCWFVWSVAVVSLPTTTKSLEMLVIGNWALEMLCHVSSSHNNDLSNDGVS